jgi:hypothetical protein
MGSLLFLRLLHSEKVSVREPRVPNLLEIGSALHRVQRARNIQAHSHQAKDG